MGAGAAMTAVAMVGSAMIQSSNEKKLARQRAGVHEWNAEVNDFKAEDALRRGAADESRHRSQTKRLLGSQRVAFAASGVDIGDMDSTAGHVASDTAYLSELDALTIRTNAQREAWGYRTGAGNDQALGRIEQAEGSARAVGIMTSTASSMLYNRYGFGSSKRTYATQAPS